MEVGCACVARCATIKGVKRENDDKDDDNDVSYCPTTFDKEEEDDDDEDDDAAVAVLLNVALVVLRLFVDFLDTVVAATAAFELLTISLYMTTFRTQ